MGWQPIETHPARPTKLLFYSARAEWRNFQRGKVVEIPDIQAVRYGIGYWDGDYYRWSGSNHDVFEFEKEGHKDLPTHWQELEDGPTDDKETP